MESFERAPAFGKRRVRGGRPDRPYGLAVKARISGGAYKLYVLELPVPLDREHEEKLSLFPAVSGLLGIVPHAFDLALELRKIRKVSEFGRAQLDRVLFHVDVPLAKIVLSALGALGEVTGDVAE